MSTNKWDSCDISSVETFTKWMTVGSLNATKKCIQLTANFTPEEATTLIRVLSDIHKILQNEERLTHVLLDPDTAFDTNDKVLLTCRTSYY